MRPFMGPRAWADANPPWRGGNGCPYNFPNFGIAAPPFRGPSSTFRGRCGGSGEPFRGRFCPPPDTRWSQPFRSRPPFPWADQMPQPWGPPFRPVHPPRFPQWFNSKHSDSPATSRQGNGDISDIERPQQAGPGDRSKTSPGTQLTSSQSLRDADNRSSPSRMFQPDTDRKILGHEKRSRSNEHRRARSPSRRSSSPRIGDRARERHRSRESKSAAKSRAQDAWKERARPCTRTRSHDEPRRSKPAESRTKVLATSRCRAEACAKRKRSTDSTTRKCICQQSKKSVAAETPKRAERTTGKSGRTADGEGNANYSATASRKKHVPRRDDFDDNESTSSKKKAMLVTCKVAFPEVPLAPISPKGSHVGSRRNSDQTKVGVGAQVSYEYSDNWERLVVRPPSEDSDQTPCSRSQLCTASPDSTVNPDSTVPAWQCELTSGEEPTEVLSTGEDGKTELAVSTGRKGPSCSAVKTKGEDVDPEVVVSEDAVGEENGIDTTGSIVRSVVPGGTTSPFRHLGMNINREHAQADGVARDVVCLPTTHDKSAKVEAEEEGTGTLTPAQCSSDTVGEALPQEVLAVLRKSGRGATDAFIPWFKSLEAPNIACNVLEERCEQKDQPADFGASGPAPTYVDLEMPSTSAATHIDLETPSTSVAAGFSADVDRDKETESIVSTATIDFDVLEASAAEEEVAPQEDCYVTCPPALSASAEGSSASRECLWPEIGARMNTAEFPALAGVEQDVLYELDTYTAVLILDLLQDAQKKNRVLLLYEMGRCTNERAAYSAKIRRLVLNAFESQPASRRSFTRKLRKLANLQWATHGLCPDASACTQGLSALGTSHKE